MKRIFFVLWLLTAAHLVTTAQQPVPAVKAEQLFSELAALLLGTDLSKPVSLEPSKLPSVHTIQGDSYEPGANSMKLAETSLIERARMYVKDRSGKLQQIDKDLLPLLAGMPQPVTDLPSAKKILLAPDERNVFSVYIRQLERYQEHLQAGARQPRQDVEQMKKMAASNATSAMSDLASSPLVVEAGGLEKLKQMTPQQRAALGKKLMEKAKNNPTAFTTIESDPRKSFADKMVKDPGYAERYRYMNNEQKREEYAAFMKENGFIENEAATSSKINAGKSDAQTRIAITEAVTSIYEHAKEMSRIAGDAEQRTMSYFESVEASLSKGYAQMVEGLAMVDHGEAGKGKETRPADLAYNILAYTVHVQEAVAMKETWHRQMQVLKTSIAEYNDLLSAYWGRNAKTDQLMTDQNLIPAAISAGICGQMIHLAKLARTLTYNNGSWQRVYDEKVKQLYE